MNAMNILKNMAFKQFGKQSNKFEQELVKNLSETGPMKFAAKKTYEFVSGTKLPETSYEQCPTRYNPQDPRTFHLRGDDDPEPYSKPRLPVGSPKAVKEATSVFRGITAAIKTVASEIKKDVK